MASLIPMKAEKMNRKRIMTGSFLKYLIMPYKKKGKSMKFKIVCGVNMHRNMGCNKTFTRAFMTALNINCGERSCL